MRKLRDFFLRLRYRNLFDGLDVIVVTGARGKSTTVETLYNILHEAGHVVGVASTDTFVAGARREANENQTLPSTTKEFVELFTAMQEQKVNKAIIEINYDQALKGEYSWLNPKVIAITHTDTVNYEGIVSKLQTKNTNVVVTSTDDMNFRNINESSNCDVLTYGVDETSTLNITKANMDEKGSRLTIQFQGETLDIHSHLLGKENAYNSLCAIGASIANSIPVGAIQKGIDRTQPLAGRMERIKLKGRRPKVVVDSAQSADEIGVSLETARNLYPKGRLISVVGASGSSNQPDRPKIGQKAAKHSDVVVITDIEPHNEDPMALLRDVRNGIAANDDLKIIEEVNRKKAIKKALKEAKTTDLIVVTGLGNKQSRRVGVKDFNWSDATIIGNS